MSGVLRKGLLVVVALLAVVIAAVGYSVHADKQRLSAAANPCEQDCLQDSGGLDDCRKLCASHPMTYGPATQQPSH